ncbi:hypothetical protein OIO89_01100 (plasmid) [Mycobacterium ulcerans]|nr:hypothetical protein OIO89_01100 [Mycobacterium ulcerans]
MDLISNNSARSARTHLHRTHLPILSNLTGQIACHDQIASPDYWTQQLRNTVRFHDTVAALLGAGEQVFLNSHLTGVDTSDHRHRRTSRRRRRSSASST